MKVLNWHGQGKKILLFSGFYIKIQKKIKPLPHLVMGKKYFFKNRFEKFQKDFSNFETPSLAVSKVRNAQKKQTFQNVPKRIKKKKKF